jgi:hypothetical protein
MVEEMLGNAFQTLGGVDRSRDTPLPCARQPRDHERHDGQLGALPTAQEVLGNPTKAA